MSDYTAHTKADIKSMLKVCKVSSIDKLFEPIDQSIRIKSLNLSKGKSQLEVYDEFDKLAKLNKQFDCILRGAGAYNHYIPPVVNHLSQREEFVTAYTPYQAEMSQGILQNIFEYQTMITNLTGMDISNASVYDGASAAAEAVAMCIDKKRNKLIISTNISPETKNTLCTHLAPLGVSIVEIGRRGKTSIDDVKAAIQEDTAAVYIEQPNYFGIIEDAKDIGKIVSLTKANFIMGVNPISLAVLNSPAQCGADIAVGEGQPLGLPLSFGGPYLGFITAKSSFMRKMPGRIVGQTLDSDGNKAFVLTLQAREQHIRREKALSNICSNQALCALRAAIYLAANGPEGLYDVALQCVSKAHFAKEEFIATGAMKEVYSDEFFHEFLLETTIDADIILEALEKKNILGGLKISQREILWCVTETVTKKDILKAARIIKGALA